MRVPTDLSDGWKHWLCKGLSPRSVSPHTCTNNEPALCISLPHAPEPLVWRADGMLTPWDGKTYRWCQLHTLTFNYIGSCVHAVFTHATSGCRDLPVWRAAVCTNCHARAAFWGRLVGGRGQGAGEGPDLPVISGVSVSVHVYPESGAA